MEIVSSVVGGLINSLAALLLSFGLFAHPVVPISTIPTNGQVSNSVHTTSMLTHANSKSFDISSWTSYSLPGIEFKAPSSTIENPRIMQGKGYGSFQVVYADQFGITIQAQTQPEKYGIVDFKDFMNFPADYSTTTNYEAFVQAAAANNETISSTTVNGIEAAQLKYDCSKTLPFKTAESIETQTAKDKVIYILSASDICNHPEAIDLYKKLLATVKFTKA